MPRWPTNDLPDGYKRCTMCGEEKQAQEFNKNKRGRYGVASVCKQCLSFEYKKTHPVKEKLKEYPDGYKKCSKCGEVKAFSMFSRGDNRDGLRSQCKPCEKEGALKYNIEYYKKNRDAILEKRRENYSENYQKNKDKINARKAAYRERKREMLKPIRDAELKAKEKQREENKKRLEEKKELDRMDREMYAIISREERLEKQRVRQRERYKIKAEEIKAYHAKYRKENKDKISEYSKKYYPIYRERNELIISAKGKLKRRGINPEENKDLLESVMLQTRLKRVIKAQKEGHKEVTNG